LYSCMVATIQPNKVNKVRKLYYEKGYSARKIAESFGVSIDAAYYFMRHHGLKRRTLKEEMSLRFERKALSFRRQKIKNAQMRTLQAIGAMLYWGEGYKGNELTRNSTVDFANSDPGMVALFLKFFRVIYKIDEKRLRVLLYCYRNQNVKELVNFWSKLTQIPKQQFSKPYVRFDFKKNTRQMAHGLVHIRYSDKKLLIEILNLIKFYKEQYIAPVG